MRRAGHIYQLPTHIRDELRARCCIVRYNNIHLRSTFWRLDVNDGLGLARVRHGDCRNDLSKPDDQQILHILYKYYSAGMVPVVTHSIIKHALNL